MSEIETQNLATPEAPAPPEEKKRPARGRGHVFWKEWVKPLLIIGLALFSFRSSVADWNDVPTGSMKPTILEGDRIFINKIAYDLKVPFTTIRLAQWDDPHWGDVVVLRSPEDSQGGTAAQSVSLINLNKRLVKRVIGLPGDVIEVRGEVLFRNGRAADYSGLDPDVIMQVDDTERPRFRFASEQIEGREHPIMLRAFLQRQFIEPFGPISIPDNQFFVMGDNRDESRDSRYFGTVQREAILGRAVGVAFSFKKKREDPLYLFWKVSLRWDRFFTKLL